MCAFVWEAPQCRQFQPHIDKEKEEAMNRRIQIAFALLLAGCATWCVGAPRPQPQTQSLSQLFKQVSGAVAVVRVREHASLRRVGDPTERTATIDGIGSGVLISADGKVITAAHVVQLADTVSVEFPGSPAVGAQVVASDPVADVALLQLDSVPAGVTPAKLGDSDRAEVGDQIFVIGAPHGISHTLTVGHLSARRSPREATGSLAMAELFQTDAAINRGNSGGPIFSMHGEVIGVVSHIISNSGGSEGLGFAVTSNMARQLLLEQPTLWSGLEGYLLSGDLARAFNLPTSAGLLVQRVADGSPAQRMGIRGGSLPMRLDADPLLLGGDIILAVADIELSEAAAREKIRRRLLDIRGNGSPLRITVLRGGEIVQIVGNP
jgi:serine protease Do